MVTNKQELLQTANAWTQRAKEDVRNQIVDFMQTTGFNEDALADAIGISTEELVSIIETNNDIPLSTFAKLLIATDNVIEIKPMESSPIAAAPRSNAQPQQQMPQQPQPRDARGRFASTRPQPQRPPFGGAPRGGMMPPRGGMPMGGRMPMGGMMPNGGHGICINPRTGRPCDPRTGRDLPMQEGGYPMPPMEEQQPRGFGGGMPGVRRPNRQPMTEVPAESLETMSRDGLVSIIRSNFWDGEIDTEEVTRRELIDFINAKRQPRQTRVAQQQMPQQPQMAQQPMMERPMAETVPVADERGAQPMATEAAAQTNAQNDASMAAFMDMLNKAVAENPNLKDSIAQFVQQ